MKETSIKEKGKVKLLVETCMARTDYHLNSVCLPYLKYRTSFTHQMPSKIIQRYKKY